MLGRNHWTLERRMAHSAGMIKAYLERNGGRRRIIQDPEKGLGHLDRGDVPRTFEESIRRARDPRRRIAHACPYTYRETRRVSP